MSILKLADVVVKIRMGSKHAESLKRVLREIKPEIGGKRVYSHTAKPTSNLSIYGEQVSKIKKGVGYGVRKKNKTRLKEVGLGVDKNGYFVYTHRARSKSYESEEKIPESKVKFIGSTG